MSALIGRRFFDELAAQIQKNVTLTTTNGKSYSGILVGYDQESMSICLGDAKDESGRVMQRLFLNGGIISEIYSKGKSFDFKGLSERLEKVFPKMVKFYEEANVIVVMNKIRIGEKGLLEGSGPAAERVQKVYEDYIKEQSK
jgi:small nuclear ribonucleoprotein (snRNP)-like protein